MRRTASVSGGLWLVSALKQRLVALHWRSSGIIGTTIEEEVAAVANESEKIATDGCVTGNKRPTRWRSSQYANVHHGRNRTTPPSDRNGTEIKMRFLFLKTRNSYLGERYNLLWLMTENVFFSTQIASCTAVLVSSARFQRFNGITVGKATWSIMIEAQSGVRRWSHICKWGKKRKTKGQNFWNKKFLPSRDNIRETGRKRKIFTKSAWGKLGGYFR